MRFIHTSDWHLGHTLRDQERTAEHAAFLQWLIDRIVDERPDALLIAGDIFDANNPPPAAVRAWYRFLLAAHDALPTMAVIVIGGNHDSGPRLDAPKELLGHFRVHVVGAVPRGPDRRIDAAAMLVPIRNLDGHLLARVAAVPFLRPSDLPGGEDPDRWVDAIREVYASVFALAPDDGVPLLAMGHSYMVGGQVSDLSERKILGGNLHALPSDIFPERVAYAALGHLHLAQKVGRQQHVRYSGSPIPLALDERAYTHQISVVDLEPGGPPAIRSLPIPRAVAVPRIPPTGSLPVAEALAALRAFPADEPAWIEVAVRMTSTDGDPNEAIEEVMLPKRARVLRVVREGGTRTATLADAESAEVLSELSCEEVFRRRWALTSKDEPLPDDLLAQFHELVDAVGASQ